MPDDIITRDDQGNLAVNTVSATEANVPYNYDDCFTVDTNGRRALRIVGGSGGGEVDYSRLIIKSSTIPTAGSDEYRKVYMYVGETDANYTHGYIYECQKTAITYTGTVSFEAATLSGTTVACSGDDFAQFLTEAGADPTPIVSGTMTYDAGAGGWRLVGKDAEDNTVTSFLEYNEDYADAGFTFTGTPQDGDVIAFTCTVEEDTVTYGWVRIDVQPAPEALPDQSGQSGKFLTTDGSTASWDSVESLPSQTGQSGKFLTTDGIDASWSDKPLVNTATGNNSLTILGTSSTGNGAINIGVGSKAAAWNLAIGFNAQSNSGTQTCCCGYAAQATHTQSVSLGAFAIALADHAIQIGSSGSATNNADANTLKVANANGNFEIMSADGTIPAARHASLPAADGTYVLKLTVSGGVPTLAWVAE